MVRCSRITVGMIFGLVVLALGAGTQARATWPFVLPEQRQMQVRHPSQFRTVRLPDLPPPLTVDDKQPPPEWSLSLDAAIRTALANSEVVRVLAGVSVASTGRTIYDPAITNTTIDQARAHFDPTVRVQNDFDREKLPVAGFDPGDPSRVLIDGFATQGYDLSAGVSKTTITGGTASLDVRTNALRDDTPGQPLNPDARSAVDLSFSQPLLQGGGIAVNRVPIVLAQLDTERSFFQLKDGVQQMVRGVIEGYWGLVFARTDVWVRQQQVKQGEEAFRFAEANLKVGRVNAADVAQSRSALAGFRASLITAEANLLQREAALRDILRLPPTPVDRIVPVSPPNTEQLSFEWQGLLRLAEQYRPDLIELKLILEADEQRLLLARNDASPRVDLNALYRWNGLRGRTPDRPLIGTDPGEFTAWQLGVTFSVPLGLRQARAELRQEELLMTRDRANLQQALHDVMNDLATSYRNLAQFYAQYRAFQETRAAARINLNVQAARYVTEQENALYLNVLQAISDWGNAVSSEAQALAQYNIELATLELQTGTILESHGVRFVEERYGSLGPMGPLFGNRCYPRDYRPGPNANRYPTTTEPAENIFHLDDPFPQRRDRSGPSSPFAPGGIRPAPLPSDVNRLRIEVPERIPLPQPRP